jgi:hypothetical protein
VQIPTIASLCVVAGIIVVSILASLFMIGRHPPDPGNGSPADSP